MSRSAVSVSLTMFVTLTAPTTAWATAPSGCDGLSTLAAIERLAVNGTSRRPLQAPLRGDGTGLRSIDDGVAQAADGSLVEVPPFIHEIAELYWLPWSTVYAALSSLGRPSQLPPHLLADGSAGIRRSGWGHVLDPSDGAVAAYAVWRERVSRGVAMNADHALQLARDMHRTATIPRWFGSPTETPRAVSLRQNGATVVLDGPLSTDAMLRLRELGVAFRTSGRRTELRYPEYREEDRHSPDPAVRRRHPLGALDELFAQVATLRSAGAPPELVAAYVARQFSLINPFRGTDGREGRMLAQLVFREMTGRDLVLSDELHTPWTRPWNELVATITGPDGAYPNRHRSTPHALALEAFVRFAVMPEVPPGMGPPRAPSPAVPFGRFSFRGLQVGKDGIVENVTIPFHDYAALPDSVRFHAPQGTDGSLYFGRPLRPRPRRDGRAPTLDDIVDAARPVVAGFFTGGRHASPGVMHNDDIVAHQGAPSRHEYNSRFFQSTSELSTAVRFATDHPSRTPTEYGIIYVLDGSSRGGDGPQLLHLNRFLEWAQENRDRFPGVSRVTNNGYCEQEVLWPQIRPQDVVGAYVIRRDPNVDTQFGYAVPIAYFGNPNYQRARPE